MSSPMTVEKFVAEIQADPGNTNKNQEDRCEYFLAPATGSLGSQIAVAVVADGIGGQEAGEEASRIAVESIKDYFTKHPTADPPSALQAAMEAAHEAINRYKAPNPKLIGMGSTVTAAVIATDRVYAGNIGDSRAYLIHKDGSIKQITKDHTWIQEALDAGRVKPEEAKFHPNRHVLKRYLGMPGSFSPDTFPPEFISPGDALLLCTDGLSDLVEENEIKDAVVSNLPKQAAKKLVDLALARGGFDNVSVIAVRVPSPADSTIAARSKLTSTVLSPLGIGAMAIAVLVVFGILAFLMMSGGSSPSTPSASGASNAATATLSSNAVAAIATVPNTPTLLPTATDVLPPTVTPLATRTSTPTATPYQPTPPAALKPSNTTFVSGDAGNISLQWTPYGDLPENYYYVVTVKRSIESKQITRTFETRDSRISLPLNLFSDAPVGSEAKFEWSVAIQHATSINVEGQKVWDLEFYNPVSKPVSFAYLAPTPTPTPTNTPIPLPTMTPTKEKSGPGGGGGQPAEPPPTGGGKGF